MNKKEELIEWYEGAFDRYGEALQDVVSDYWQEKYGDDSWEEFHSLDGKLKVKFYYEGEYSLFLYWMHQRKGRFVVNIVEDFTQNDVESFLEFVKPRFEHLKSLWQPLV